MCEQKRGVRKQSKAFRAATAAASQRAAVAAVAAAAAAAVDLGPATDLLGE
jgi:hypothetical protein